MQNEQHYVTGNVPELGYHFELDKQYEAPATRLPLFKPTAACGGNFYLFEGGCAT